jgi:hypothetical protein
MHEQDSKAGRLVVWIAMIAAFAAACGPAAFDPPPAPPKVPPPLLETGCFSASECTGGEICVDPRYPACGNAPACEEGGVIACGCACVTPCTATSCGTGEVCGPAGCCEPRPCASDAQCGQADTRCVSGRCTRRGTCVVPPS